MDKIIRWYNKYYTEITWFIIGVLTLDFLQCFGRGDWVGMLWSGALIWLNVALSKRSI